MLDNGAVDAELIPGVGGPRGGLRFGHERFQHRVDDGVVPCGGLGVVVGRGGREGRVAGVVADLTEPGLRDGLCIQ